MKLSQGQKIMVGIFTAIPFLLTPYIIYEVFHFVIDTVEASEFGDPEPATILTGVFSFIFPIILVSVTSLGLLVFYIVHAVANKSIDSTERIIWILIFVFIGIIAFPIYWFMRLWNEPK